MAMAKGGEYTGRYKGEHAKQRFGEDTAELFRQGLVGSLSWALLGALGSFGYLSFTGGGEDDKDRRNVGNVREALRVGYGPEVRAGYYAFNLNRMGPVGQAAGIAADRPPRAGSETGDDGGAGRGGRNRRRGQGPRGNGVVPDGRQSGAGGGQNRRREDWGDKPESGGANQPDPPVTASTG